MKSFLQLVEEKETTHKPVVMAFGRMNPPTTGHLKLVDKVREIADKQKAKHTIIVSHSQDSKKNPLSGEQKVKHLNRYSPGTHFEPSTKDSPTILHHAAKLHAKGHDHLTVVAGSDRVKEMHDLLHKYNGVSGKHGHYNFKKIEVKSAGHRDPDAEGAEGMSGTKMREHAKNKDFSSFRQGVPHHVSDHHAKELMHDVRKGMGLHESVQQFKAIFVTGGPGSGKDVILREAIANANAVELNFIQAFDYLSDKQKLSEKSNDYRREAIRYRGPLIINGPADDSQRIDYINEELKELGYDTLMVYVDTTNEASQERNTKLTRMMVESVRQDKWTQSQQNKETFGEQFSRNFIHFDNSGSLNDIEESITDTYQIINKFYNTNSYNQTQIEWLDRNGKLNINEKFNLTFKEDKNDKGNSKLFQKLTVKGRYSPALRAATPTDFPADNRAGENNADNIKWDASKRNGTYTFRTYSEAKTPTLKINPTPKEPRFQTDNDKEKIKKRGDKSLNGGRIGRPDGLGSEINTRTNGTGLTGGAGLGGQTYSEDVTGNYDVANFSGQPSGGSPNPLSNSHDQKKDFKKFRKTIKEFNGFQNDAEMAGVGGVLGGSSNMDRMQSYKDSERNIGTQIKKKKKQEK